jgi:drug/metabolite transporter (DMT)-like permease
MALTKPAEITAGSTLLGAAAVLGYNFLSASKEVYSGHLVQEYDPFLITGLVFACAFGIFQTLALVLSRANYRVPLSQRGDLAWLNLHTSGAWIGFFFSVKYLEPAIVSVVMVGLGPAIAVFASPLISRDQKLDAWEAVCATGILLSTILLTIISLEGKSAIGLTNGLNVALGLAAAAAGSGAMVGASMYSKRLSEAGAKPVSIMAHRFYILLPLSVAAAFLLRPAGEALPAMPPVEIIAGLSVLGVAIPLWLLQIGIQNLRPVEVIMIIATAPAFTFALQALDPRLSLNVAVLGCILFMCGCVLCSRLKPQITNLARTISGRAGQTRSS